MSNFPRAKRMMKARDGEEAVPHYADATMNALTAKIREGALRRGLRRERGALAREVWWAEFGGRGADGSWYELRVHHRPEQKKIQAGLLGYRPLTQGGRTIELGSISRDYDDPADEVPNVAEAVLTWLFMLPEDPYYEAAKRLCASCGHPKHAKGLCTNRHRKAHCLCRAEG